VQLPHPATCITEHEAEAAWSSKVAVKVWLKSFESGATVLRRGPVGDGLDRAGEAEAH
jgi:hypothetical protein